MSINIVTPAVTPLIEGKAKYSITGVIAVLAFTMFVTVTSEFVVMGLLPIMAIDLNISLANAGWFVTWFALAASFLGPPFTLFVGRYSRHGFLVTSMIIFSISNLTIALTQQYYVIVAIRILQGILLPAIVSILVVEAVRLSEVERRGWAISGVNLGIVVTTVFGIPAGAMIADELGWFASFVALGLLSIIAAMSLFWALPNTSKTDKKQDLLFSDISSLWRSSFLIHLLLSAIIFAGMFTGYTYIAALLTKVANLDNSMLGWLLMGFGISGVAGNWLAGRVVDSNPIAASAIVALLLALAMLAITPIGNNVFVLTLVVALWGSSHMAAFVINQVRVMQAGSSAQTFSLSLNISACNLGIALGPIIGGYIIDSYSIDFVGYAGSATVALGFVMAILMMVYRSLSTRR